MSGELNLVNLLARTGHKEEEPWLCPSMFKVHPDQHSLPTQRSPGPERAEAPEDLPQLLTMDQALLQSRTSQTLQIGCLNVLAVFTSMFTQLAEYNLT